jgi:hypothetical protein
VTAEDLAEALGLSTPRADLREIVPREFAQRPHAEKNKSGH